MGDFMDRWLQLMMVLALALSSGSFACSSKSVKETTPLDSPKAAVKGTKPYKPDFVPLALGPVMPKSLLHKKAASLRLTSVTRDTTVKATTDSAEGISQITAGVRLLRQALGTAGQELILFDTARIKVANYCELQGGGSWTTCKIAAGAITTHFTSEMLAYVLDQMGDDSATDDELKALNDKVGQRVSLNAMNFSRVSDGTFDYTLEYTASPNNVHSYRWDTARTRFDLSVTFDGTSDSGNDFEGIFRARFDATNKVTTFRALGVDGPDAIQFNATIQSTGGADDEVMFSSALSELVAGYGTIAFGAEGVANSSGGHAESAYTFPTLSAITATPSIALTSGKTYYFAPSSDDTLNFSWNRALGSGTVDSANTSSFSSDGFAYWGPRTPPAAMKVFACDSDDQARLKDCTDSGATLSLGLTRTTTRYFYTSQWNGSSEGTYYCSRSDANGECLGTSGTKSTTFDDLYSAKVGDTIDFTGDIAISLLGADEVTLAGQDFIVVDSKAGDLTAISPTAVERYANRVLATGVFIFDPAAVTAFNGLGNYEIQSSVVKTAELTDVGIFTYSFDSNGKRVFKLISDVAIEAAE